MIGLGLLMVYSSSYHESQENYGNGTHYLFRQAIAALVGIVVMLLAMRIDYRLYQQSPFVLFAVGLTLALLVLVLIMGSGEGTRRWLSIGPLNLQPSEIAKLTTVLFLARYLSRKDGKINDWWNGLLPALAVVGSLSLLILLEPDLGTAAAVVMVAGIMLVVAGMAWRYIIGFGTLAVALAGTQIWMTGYQTRRIMAFLNPWADQLDVGFQTVQSLIAVGTGGITGVGLAEGK